MLNSRLSIARNIILAENIRFRSSQPRKAAKRYSKVYQKIGENQKQKIYNEKSSSIKMSEFHPKISERETDELIEIANSTNKVWKQDAINQAKAELTKRKITEEEQNRFFEGKLEEINDDFKKREIKLKANEMEKYNFFQMLLIIIITPFIVIRQYRVLRDLKENNYTLKFKQRLVLLIAGMIIWLGLFYVEFKKWEKAEFNKPSRY